MNSVRPNSGYAYQMTLLTELVYLVAAAVLLMSLSSLWDVELFGQPWLLLVVLAMVPAGFAMLRQAGWMAVSLCFFGCLVYVTAVMPIVLLVASTRSFSVTIACVVAVTFGWLALMQLILRRWRRPAVGVTIRRQRRVCGGLAALLAIDCGYLLLQRVDLLPMQRSSGPGTGLLVLSLALTGITTLAYLYMVRNASLDQDRFSGCNPGGDGREFQDDVSGRHQQGSEFDA